MIKYNRFKSIVFFSTLGSMVFLNANQTFAKEYYKWVDSNGSTHYTSTPPPKSAKKKGKVETYNWKSQSPTTASATSTMPVPSQPPSATNNQQTVEGQNSLTEVTNNPSSNLKTPVMDAQQREANEALRRK